MAAPSSCPNASNWKRCGDSLTPLTELKRWAVNERVQLDGGPLPQEAFLAHLNAFLPEARAFGEELTYF